MRRNVETVTKEELKERLIRREKQAVCPTCGAQRHRERVMSGFESDLVDWLRLNRIVRRESCLLCVQKHVGRAMEYYNEMITSKNSGNVDGVGAINVKLNHLALLGHLGCAIEECDDFPDLQDLIVAQERQYRYEGVEPDWKCIAELIIKAEENESCKNN